MVTLFLLSLIFVPPDGGIQVKQYSISDGLSQSFVSSFAQDHEGFLWIGTYGGLNQYNGYAFSSYKKNPRNSASLTGSLIDLIEPLDEEHLAVAVNDSSINIFNLNTKQVVFDTSALSRGELGRAAWLDLLFDGSRNILVAASNKGLFLLKFKKPGLSLIQHISEFEGKRFLPYSFSQVDGKTFLGSNQGIFQLENQVLIKLATIPEDVKRNVKLFAFDEPQQSIWIGTDVGLFYSDPPYARWESVDLSNDRRVSEGSIRINRLFLDSQQNFWAATNGWGAFRIDRRKRAAQPIHFVELSSLRDINVDVIYDVFEDRSGMLWFGTRNGILSFDPHSAVFKNFGVNQKGMERFELLNSEMIFVQNDEIRGFDLQSNSYKTYGKISQWVGQEINLVDIAIAEDRSLWLASENGIWRAAQLGAPLKPMSVETSPGDRIHRISRIHGGLDGKMWIASGRGAYYLSSQNRLDRVPGPAYRYHALMADSRGGIWLASEANGVVYWNPNTNDQRRLEIDYVMSFYEQNSNTVWAASYGEGLVRISRKPQGFETQLYLEEDGLADNAVYAVLEDDQDRLWCSTNKGISCFDLATETFVNYDATDGLLSNEFTYGSAKKAVGGTLFFANSKGINYFKPKDIRTNEVPPKVVLSNAWIYDNPYQPESGSLNQLEEMLLNYDQQVVSFQFAALDFTNATKNQYSYRLSGQDDEWVNLGTKRDITFSQLAAGEHVLEVRGSNNDGVWSLKPYRLKLRIASHPLWSLPAKILYGCLALLLIYLYLQFKQSIHRRELKRQEELLKKQESLIKAETQAKVQEQNAREQISKALEREQIAREAANQALEKERQALTSLQQTSQLKSDFLANTSHELRTPLNGIVGIADSLLEGIAGSLSPPLYKNLRLISSSGKRLTRLINDILDFSKMEANRFEVSIQPIELNLAMEAVLSLTEPLSHNKGLVVENNLGDDLPLVEADEDRLQQILYNLIGNAIKFTHQGQIEISAEAQTDKVWVHVSDSGIGIPDDKLEQIFNAFEQVKGAADRAYEGTGLGLAVTKQLVMLLDGQITVQSKLGEGSRFSFCLPRSRETIASNRLLNDEKLNALANNLDTEEETRIFYEIADIPGEGADVLVVDDNPVNLQVIVNHLSLKNFRIRQAASGGEALQLIDAEKPDLILLDVMMPEMNGYDVCRRIRETYSADDLPVVLLTAKNQVADLVQGFEAGANDFITKPVNAMELFSRMKNHLKLLEARQALFSSYQKVNQIVDDQTQELKRKNESLSERNKELEAHDRIVKVINRQVDLKPLFQSILDQCLKYCLHASSGALFFSEPNYKQLALCSLIGFEDKQGMLGRTFEMEDLVSQYMPEGCEDFSGMYHLHEADMAHFDRSLPHTNEMLVLRLGSQDRLLGLVMLGIDVKKGGFTPKDMNQVKQLIGHLEIAVIRADNIREIKIKGEENVRMQQELNYQERLAALGEMTAGVAHEIQNPLNLINNFAMVTYQQCREIEEELEEETPPPQELRTALKDLAENARLIEHHGNRASKIIREMLSHTRGMGGEKQLVDFNQVVTEHVNMAKDAKLPQLNGVDVEVMMHLAPDLGMVPMYVLDMGRGITNLVENAIYSSAKRAEKEQRKGMVMVSTRIENEQLVLKVEDNGCGIPEKDRERIFDPFYTTKPVGEGTGLGLSLTHATVVKGHHGTIRVSENDEGGATFTITMPQA